MKNIDTQLTSHQKLDIAKNYGTRLFLEIKEEKEGGCHEIAALWLEKLAWGETTLHKKVLELQGLFSMYGL